MPRALPLPPPGFDDLPVEEKLAYVQSLWERIASRPAELQVPDWHQRVLEERLAAHQADPDSARPWGEVRQEIAETLKDYRLRRR